MITTNPVIPWALRIVVCTFFAVVTTSLTAAEIEFLDGTKLTGRTVSKNKTHLKVEVEEGGEKVVRDYDLSEIHKVVINDKTYILNERTSTDDSDASGLRTRQQILDLINEQGRTPPDWFDTTPLEFPASLDLDWPMPAPKPWNNQKNIGQYIWDVINPNPGRWQGGIRFMHHLLNEKQNDQELRRRTMASLGGMYFRFFQDYARAAFWWRQSGVNKGDEDSLGLAECYWRLGNKQMARQYIDERRVRVGTIKLLGDMGETQTALRIAGIFEKQAKEPHHALLAAGDACRNAGQLKQAIKYYQKVLAQPAMKSDGHYQRVLERARGGIEAIELFEFTDPSRAADGSYESDSLGYEGPIVVAVDVQAGRIEQVRIVKHKEKQFYSALRDVPEQIVAKQGVKNVEATSRATITAEAVIHATAKALAAATRGNSQNPTSP